MIDPIQNSIKKFSDISQAKQINCSSATSAAAIKRTRSLIVVQDVQKDKMKQKTKFDFQKLMTMQIIKEMTGLNTKLIKDAIISKSLTMDEANAILEQFLKVDPKFICPLTKHLMSNPVTDCFGDVYENSAIEDYMEKHENSPQNQQKFLHYELKPNNRLKLEINKFKDTMVSQSYEIIDRLLKFNFFPQAEKIINFIHSLGPDSAYHNKKILRRFIKYFAQTQNYEKKMQYQRELIEVCKSESNFEKLEKYWSQYEGNKQEILEELDLEQKYGIKDMFRIKQKWIYYFQICEMIIQVHKEFNDEKKIINLFKELSQAKKKLKDMEKALDYDLKVAEYAYIHTDYLTAAQYFEEVLKSQPNNTEIAEKLLFSLNKQEKDIESLLVQVNVLFSDQCISIQNQDLCNKYKDSMIETIKKINNKQILQEKQAETKIQELTSRLATLEQHNQKYQQMLDANYALFKVDQDIKDGFAFTQQSMKNQQIGIILGPKRIQCLQNNCKVGFFLVDFDFMTIKKYTKFLWSVKFVQGGIGCCEQIGVAYTKRVKESNFDFSSEKNLFGIGMYSGEVFQEDKQLASHQTFKLRPGDEVEFLFNKIDTTLTIQRNNKYQQIQFNLDILNETGLSPFVGSCHNNTIFEIQLKEFYN